MVSGIVVGKNVVSDFAWIDVLKHFGQCYA